MKKIKLKLEGKAAMLTRDQMKKITGGYGCCRCWVFGNPGDYFNTPANGSGGCDPYCTPVPGSC